VHCDQFTTDLLELTEAVDCVAGCDGVLIAIEGSGTVGGVPVQAGQVCMTSGSGSVRIEPKGKLKLLHAQCGSEV
jgi:hypothetical protein